MSAKRLTFCPGDNEFIKFCYWAKPQVPELAYVGKCPEAYGAGPSAGRVLNRKFTCVFNICIFPDHTLWKMTGEILRYRYISNVVLQMAIILPLSWKYELCDSWLSWGNDWAFANLSSFGWYEAYLWYLWQCTHGELLKLRSFLLTRTDFNNNVHYHMPSKVWDAPLNFGNRHVIHSNFCKGCNYFSILGLKLNFISIIMGPYDHIVRNRVYFCPHFRGYYGGMETYRVALYLLFWGTTNTAR